MLPVPPRTRHLLLLLVAMVAAALPAAPASGQTASDPYTADPLRLVPFTDTVQRVYSGGVDTWEVWVCDVPGWDVTLDPAQVAVTLNGAVTPYFKWLSLGVYSPLFVIGGRVASDDQIPTSPSGTEGLVAPGCEQEVAAASDDTANGALIVVEGGTTQGAGTAGSVCPELPFNGCATTYPSNFRRALVAAGAVTPVAPFQVARWGTVAHEIGHALNWGHSYGGLNLLDDGVTVNQYDNPMDVMSRGSFNDSPTGTIAYHRYAAGWIRPGEVANHPGGDGTYRLSSSGAEGAQLLVLRSEEDRLVYTLGLREQASFDAAIPKAGVEVYRVDQREGQGCDLPAAWPDQWPCFATFTRISQVPAVDDPASSGHVLAAGQTVTVGPYTVQVVDSTGSRATVVVDDSRSGFRFRDDDGNPHEPNIETIAAAGITRGCNPPLGDLYCPAAPVTRAEMAAFLLRAVGADKSLPTRYRGYFSDVPPGEWFTPYVEKLFELGLTTGYTDGTYRPSAAVSRAEMAAFLVRTFRLDLREPVGVFGDVPTSAWYVDEVEALYFAGITRGCLTDPLSYCPAQPVLRDAMASFLARALGTGS